MSQKVTTYTKIVDRKIPARIVYEDALTLAFLDHNPVTRGHCLVIPKEPIDHLDDCGEILYQNLFSTVHKVSRLLKQRLGAERIGLVVHGYEIPHAHIHVIPIYKQGDLRFTQRPERIVPQEELQHTLDILMSGQDAHA